MFEASRLVLNNIYLCVQCTMFNKLNNTYLIVFVCNTVYYFIYVYSIAAVFLNSQKREAEAL